MNDLSVTALYTSATWAWGRVPNADLLLDKDARRVFAATNAALRLLRGRPSLPHSLMLRHEVIDERFRRSGARRLIELAAGLSPRGVTATADPKITCVEVDRPQVIARKRALLGRTAAGRAALARPNLRFVERDLAAGPLTDLGADEPTFVVAEGLLMYLAAAAQRDLWRRVRELLGARQGTFVFDLVPMAEQPPPGAIGRLLERVMKRFTGGATFARDARTRDDLRRELADAGFAVELVEPRHPTVPTQQLLFVCST